MEKYKTVEEYIKNKTVRRFSKQNRSTKRKTKAIRAGVRISFSTLNERFLTRIPVKTDRSTNL
ncbi:MAG: hypothetical protein CO128_00130 [Ignavibacteriales bacterium CG_4_9_14_3_um_filter_30_11]|nr:MAG: hypothetical protein CO128_00130 [Ignavibacteriales bacterium CG_4_9_14_3_um_filter_30_11]